MELAILMIVSGFILMCSVPLWLSRHAWKPRAGIKIGKEAFDTSFWLAILSFFALAMCALTIVIPH